MATIPLVLHATYQLMEIADSLKGIPGTTVISASSNPDRTAAALSTGAPVLVTSEWDDRYFTGALRWLQSISVGLDHLPLSALEERGVVVTSARGIHAPQMAEHAFALLLALTRNLAQAIHRSHDGQWIPRIGSELGDVKIGVLGLGTVGEEVARRAKCWDLAVIGTKMHSDNYRGSADVVYGPNETLRVCAESDAVIVTLPLTPATLRLIDASALEALGRGWLVNIGRGAVLDETAVLNALTSGELQGAGLDVFTTEPLPSDSPFWTLENVIVTSHSAGLSPRYGERLGKLVARNLQSFRGEIEWTHQVHGTEY